MLKLTDVYFLEDNEYIGTYSEGFGMIGNIIPGANTNNMLKNVYLPKTENFKFIYG